jgi:hypothetical protein
MNPTLLLLISTVATTSAASAGGQTPEESQESVPEPSNVDRANQFFVTQIYDAQWNPSGSILDTNSNNCGPASSAMLMAAGGVSPTDFGTDAAIDYARVSGTSPPRGLNQLNRT